MKIKKGYLLREVAGNYVVVPTGKAALDFSGVMTLNETGAFLWTRLTQDTAEQQLLSDMQEKYEVNEDEARTDIHEFIDKLKAANLIE